MVFKFIWFCIAGLYYFPMVLHIPIIELDPAWMIEDGLTRIILSIIFWGILIFYDGSGINNSPIGGY